MREKSLSSSPKGSESEQVPWKNFTTKDGLLSNQVYCAAMDSSGHLWFGCKNPNGVARFDGSRWEQFTTQTCGIGPGHVWDLAFDRAGSLWLGTAGGGLSAYDGRTWRRYTRANGLAGDYVYAVKVDAVGRIWCGCAPKPDTIAQEGGVSVFDGKRFESFTSDNVQGQHVGGGNSGLCDNRVYSIAFDTKGRTWFGTKGGGICRFDGEDWRTFNKATGLPVNEVGDGAAAVDRDRKVWFGLRGGGACRFDENSFKAFTMKDGLAGDFVYAIQPGPDGRLWFGCSPHPEQTDREGGVSAFDGQSFLNYTSDYVGREYVGGGNSPLANNRVYAIVFDRDGNAWFGTKGGGVSRFGREAIRPSR